MMLKLGTKELGYEGKKYRTRSLPAFLHMTMEVEPGFTLKDLLSILAESPREWAKVLRSHYLKEILREAKGPAKEREKKPIRIIDVGWYGECWAHRGFRKEFNFYADVSGRTGKRGRTSYAIEFSPVPELLKAEIVIGKTAKLRRELKYEDLGFYAPTVMEFVKAIVDELTFHGSPKNREKRKKDIMARMKEVKSGKAKLIPFKDVMKNLKKRIRERKAQESKDKA